VVIGTPKEIKGTGYINCGGCQSTRLGTSTNNGSGISVDLCFCENSQKVSVQRDPDLGNLRIIYCKNGERDGCILFKYQC
jgi:hypothetical protein